MKSSSLSKLALVSFLLSLGVPLITHAAAPIRFTGQLIELSSTTAPTTIVVRVNPTSNFTDETVSINTQTELDSTMDGWIPGDTVTVTGTQDPATSLVTASEVGDNSINAKTEANLNGWVKAVDPTASTVTITWQNVDTTVAVNAQTRLVVGSQNPAQLSDLQIGDRVRLRVTGPATQPTAEIIIALRRGNQIFLMARTRPFSGTVVGLDASRSLINVQLAADPTLQPDDVNNLVGVAGEIVSVTYEATTKFVAADGSQSMASAIGAGDGIFVIGRVGDDGTIDARVVQDVSPVVSSQAPFMGFDGVVTGFEPSEGVVNLKLNSTGATWTVQYSSATRFYRGATAVSGLNVAVGDEIVVKGYQNNQLYTIPASAIAVVPPATRPTTPTQPLERIRPLADIITDRIKTGLGQMSASDIVSAQPPASAEQTSDASSDSSGGM